MRDATKRQFMASLSAVARAAVPPNYDSIWSPAVAKKDVAAATGNGKAALPVPAQSKQTIAKRDMGQGGKVIHAPAPNPKLPRSLPQPVSGADDEDDADDDDAGDAGDEEDDGDDQGDENDEDGEGDEDGENGGHDEDDEEDMEKEQLADLSSLEQKYLSHVRFLLTQCPPLLSLSV
jgi:hypothetical protein